VSHAVAANSVLQRLGSNLSGFVTRNFQYSGFFPCLLFNCSIYSERRQVRLVGSFFIPPFQQKNQVTLPASVNKKAYEN
jgi:hypothetical protein